MRMEKMPEDRKLKVLASSILFRGFDSQTLEAALKLFRCRTEAYEKGELLHPSESPLRAFGLVLSGSVMACADDMDGNMMIMAEVRPGQTFGESLCFLKVGDSPVYIRAAVDSEVAWLYLDDIFSKNANRPTSAMSSEPGLKPDLEPVPDSGSGQYPGLVAELQHRFTAMLAHRTLEMNSRIQVLSKLRIRDKLATFFHEQASTAGSDSFTVSMNREDLAAYIGTERSALSRELSRMKKNGLIDYRGNKFKLIRK